MGFAINRVIIDGNLTADPELRSLPSGMSVCNLRFAHNARRKNSASGEWEDVPYYFSATMWSGQGEWVAKNLSKGSKIIIEGELRWRSYTDKNDNKREIVDINVDNLIAPRPAGDGGGSGGGFSARSDVPVDDGGFQAQGAGADDDIPF